MYLILKWFTENLRHLVLEHKPPKYILYWWKEQFHHLNSIEILNLLCAVRTLS